MGRTNPTYRDFLDGYRDRWSPYRRALRRRHREDFDRLFEHARTHADAAGHQNGTEPQLAVLVSMLLGQQRELRELRENAGELRERVRELDGADRSEDEDRSSADD